jgi:hypothetical protein
LNAGVWFRRGRLGMVSPDSQATACLPSGRNSTYRPVQISGTGSIPVKSSFFILLLSLTLQFFKLTVLQLQITEANVVDGATHRDLLAFIPLNNFVEYSLIQHITDDTV